VWQAMAQSPPTYQKLHKGDTLKNDGTFDGTFQNVIEET
jgi:hypothetical protein